MKIKILTRQYFSIFTLFLLFSCNHDKYNGLNTSFFQREAYKKSSATKKIKFLDVINKLLISKYSLAGFLSIKVIPEDIPSVRHLEFKKASTIIIPSKIKTGPDKI